MRRFLLVIVAFITILSSCSTDFDVNSEWKDISIVYGLLNVNDSINYIKVSKSFLGEQNAYSMAQIYDSLYYKDAIVTIEEYKNGNKTNTISLEKNTDLIKDSGYFAYPNTQVYKLDYKLSAVADYKLNIYLPDQDKSISSSTNLINDLDIDALAPIFSVSNYSNIFELKWFSSENAKIYEVTIRLHYKEINTSTSETVDKYLDWSLPSKVSSTIKGNEKMLITFVNESFFKYVASKLKPVEGIKRVVNKNAIDIKFLLGGEDLYTYIEVTKPSSGIVQEKPSFTNIENGIGVFSSVYNRDFLGRPMHDKTVDSLAKGIHTKHLKFADHNDLDYLNQ